MIALMKGKPDNWVCRNNLPSGKFPDLKATSPVAFFWRAVSKFLSVVSGSTAIVGEGE